MENKKTKPTMKVVNNNEVKDEKKYSYEELESICAKVVDDNRKLVAQLRSMQQTFLFQRLDFLLRIIGMSDKFNDAEYITNCIEEVKILMVREEDKSEKSKEG